MWMMPLHLHVNQKSDYDDDMILLDVFTHNTWNFDMFFTSPTVMGCLFPCMRFRTFDILTSVDSDKPLQPPFKLRNSK